LCIDCQKKSYCLFSKLYHVVFKRKGYPIPFFPDLILQGYMLEALLNVAAKNWKKKVFWAITAAAKEKFNLLADVEGKKNFIKNKIELQT